MRSLFLTVAVMLSALTVGLTPSALAAPAKEAKGGVPEGDAAKEFARAIDLPGLVVPIFDDTRKLRGYIFLNARFLVAEGRDVWKYRDKAHFIRDQVLGLAHKVSLSAKDDPSRLDEALASREFLRIANQAVGENGSIVKVTFNKIASQTMK